MTPGGADSSGGSPPPPKVQDAIPLDWKELLESLMEKANGKTQWASKAETKVVQELMQLLVRCQGLWNRLLLERSLQSLSWPKAVCQAPCERNSFSHDMSCYSALAEEVIRHLSKGKHEVSESCVRLD